MRCVRHTTRLALIAGIGLIALVSACSSSWSTRPMTVTPLTRSWPLGDTFQLEGDGCPTPWGLSAGLSDKDTDHPNGGGFYRPDTQTRGGQWSDPLIVNGLPAGTYRLHVICSDPAKGEDSPGRGVRYVP